MERRKNDHESMLAESTSAFKAVRRPLTEAAAVGDSVVGASAAFLDTLANAAFASHSTREATVRDAL
jgi:hypothetical protein